MTKHTLIATSAITALLLSTAFALPHAPQDASTPAGSWRSAPVWHDGKAEFALYDAVRPIYGVPRQYEATIFTNKQRMDPTTTTKAADWRAPGTLEVFKHNLSELIPTENYVYRFLTTCFVSTDDLTPYKIVFSSQEDCGATYKQFIVDAGTVRAEQYCYFPDGGAEPTAFKAPAGLAFHDALSLTLRDYPFDQTDHPTLTLQLVPDQTDTHETGQRPKRATVEYAGRETLTVPYGSVDAHRLRVTHDRDGDRPTSDYWFAADPLLLNVMVQYAGPYGVEYRLKKLARWAYWDRGAPQP